MKVCANCFNNKEIKKYIANIGSDSISVCPVCGEEGYPKIELDEDGLFDFLESLKQLFVEDRRGIEYARILQQEWNLFHSEHIGRRILCHILGLTSSDELPTVSYSDSILTARAQWTLLKSKVRESTRFFADVRSFNWDVLIQPSYTLDKGTILHRARIIPKGRKTLKISEMGCPPPELASAGRANPLGIPYLYLCQEPETTLYETRCVYLDSVVIGHFRIRKDLKLVDFDEELDLYYLYSTANSNLSLPEVVKLKFLMEEISRDMSRPLRRFDTEVEYIPTQWICEFCKQIGADGIKFRSSLYPEGRNIVLFHAEDAECIGVDQYEISEVIINSRAQPTVNTPLSPPSLRWGRRKKTHRRR